ncbi:MAG: response regulator, partial [Candidatus Marinimicrobia bacterium]|nr:response regulator [Candidatus Neomarinimicrobiota bacterium]
MDSQHIIDEIKDNVSKKDFIKAKIIMQGFRDMDEKVQNRILFELFKGDTDFVVDIISILLSFCNEDCKPLPIIKDTLVAKLLESPDILEKFLLNDEISNKSQFIELAGEIGMEEALPILNDLLTRTQDNAIILQVIKTFGTIGDPKSINHLGDYLYSGEKELIVASIVALGNIGTPTSMRRLAERMGTDINIDLIILKVFTKVQDNIALEKLNEMISSHYTHLRNYAKDSLVTIGAKSVPVLLGNLLYDDHDLLIHTLNILGEIGDESVINPIRKLLYTEPKDANVRFAAYEAFALLPMKKGPFILIDGLQDKEESVAVAATKAIEEHFNDILAAGIRNLIKSDDESSEKICKSILNSSVEKIFLGVIEEEIFQKYLIEKLPKTHTDTQKFYTDILKKNNYNTLYTKLKPCKEKTNTKLKICAVDDSRMILNIYKTTLHKIGFNPLLFEFPESALEYIQSEKPDILFTDLNMPKMNGVQLTEAIRKKYTHDELPIIMVTTQNDTQDTEAAYKAGISNILFKPFSADQL